MKTSFKKSGKFGILLAGASLAALGALIIAAGCGGDTAGDTATAPTVSTAKTAAATTAATSTAATDTTAADASPGDTATVVTPPAPPAPSSSSSFEITDRQVSPEVIAPGGALTFSAWVRGEASSVTIKAYRQDSGTLTMTVPLAFTVHAGSGIDRWSATTAAPAAKGAYRYYASGVSSGGATAEMPGVSGWTFCVGDPSVDCP